MGDPGVGKTALAEGLAKNIVENKVPKVLKNVTIFALEMSTLLAGTRYRGDFEERLNNIIKDITSDKNNILFIDEIHTVIGAGATSGGSIDASNILKPALANGTLRCIGSTTYTEYRKYFEKDSALVRRFQKVDINEPSVDDAIEILKGVVTNFEKFHKVKYSEDVIVEAVKLSAKFINDRKLPDKAIDVIDEVGARYNLLNTKKQINVKDVEDIISKIAKIPSKNISISDDFSHNEWNIIDVNVTHTDVEYLCCPGEYYPNTFSRSASEFDLQLQQKNTFPFHIGDMSHWNLANETYKAEFSTSC